MNCIFLGAQVMFSSLLSITYPPAPGLQYEIVWVLHEIRFEKPSLLRTELTASGTVGFTDHTVSFIQCIS